MASKRVGGRKSVKSTLDKTLPPCNFTNRPVWFTYNWDSKNV